MFSKAKSSRLKLVLVFTCGFTSNDLTLMLLTSLLLTKFFNITASVLIAALELVAVSVKETVTPLFFEAKEFKLLARGAPFVSAWINDSALSPNKWLELLKLEASDFNKFELSKTTFLSFNEFWAAVRLEVKVFDITLFLFDTKVLLTLSESFIVFNKSTDWAPIDTFFELDLLSVNFVSSTILLPLTSWLKTRFKLELLSVNLVPFIAPSISSSLIT